MVISGDGEWRLRPVAAGDGGLVEGHPETGFWGRWEMLP